MDNGLTRVRITSKSAIFTVFLLFLTQNSHRWPKEVFQSAGNLILIIFLFLVTSLARLEAEISIPAPSYTNPNVTTKCDDWVGKGGRAEGSTSVTSFGFLKKRRKGLVFGSPPKF